MLFRSQVFHENIMLKDLGRFSAEIISGGFRQVNAWAGMGEHILLISKSGACSYKLNRMAGNIKSVPAQHNRNLNP